jgi:hypothetical protein
MEYKEKVKYLDIVIENIENTDMFYISDILYKQNNLSYNEIEDIELDLISFGAKDKLNLFTLLKPKTNRCLKLTEKGEKLKLFKKGFEKFENKLKPKKHNLYLIIPIILTFLFGSSTVYFGVLNYRLNLQESKIPSLELKVDSLKKQLNYIGNKLIECKEKPLNKTLDTKKKSE